MTYVTQRQIERLNDLAGELEIENVDAWVAENHGGVVKGLADLSEHQAQMLIDRWQEEIQVKLETGG